MPPMTGLQFYNDKMLTLAEHWDEFIMSRTQKNPNIWHDRIPRGAYTLFNGLEQKTNIYRGGLPVQAGLKTWKEIGLSRKASGGDPGFDNCNPGTPQTYSYAWETLTYKGYQDHWQSEPVCLNDLKFIDYAKDQLGLIVRTGVDFGVSMLENWNREMYVQQAMLANRGMLLCTGSLDFEDNAEHRFTYDPFVTTVDENGEAVPYLVMPGDADLSTLNWDFIDYLRASLAERAGEAKIGDDGGMPVFGLMIDHLDFERMIKQDPELREDWRFAQPQALISGYNMGVKVYRGMAIYHDARQMRFNSLNINADGDRICTRVKPLKSGRQVTIGHVPEPNPKFWRAEIGVAVIWMNDVLQNLFVPSIDNLGSGMTFGPAPGLTGEWKWLNIPDPETNMLGESGFFYGRFQLFPKPLLFANDCTVFAYRRCPQALSKNCAIDSDDAVVSGAVGIKANATAAEFDGTNRRITLHLNSLIEAGLGDVVTIKKAGGTSFSAQVAEGSLATDYVFIWAAGATNEPTAETDFTSAVTTVTVA